MNAKIHECVDIAVFGKIRKSISMVSEILEVLVRIVSRIDTIIINEYLSIVRNIYYELNEIQ